MSQLLTTDYLLLKHRLVVAKEGCRPKIKRAATLVTL